MVGQFAIPKWALLITICSTLSVANILPANGQQTESDRTPATEKQAGDLKSSADEQGKAKTNGDIQTGIEPETSDETDLAISLDEALDGHSMHGDAFNEGPRQKAYLMGGTGNVDFPVTTNSPEAQAFINQGVGQLHGFWYLEAERSFRQAAAIDANCAMAYWGAAMAANATRDRARGFIQEAVTIKKELGDKITNRESAHIDALEKYYSDKEKDKSKRAQTLLKDLESIVIKHPDDLETKAFVAHRIWHNSREGIPISSYVAADYLIEDILRHDPLHPANHYLIHLWDQRHPESATRAAARCGPSAPGIAHMWHMPGHIYSRLKRYEDAVYQQEAAARVDHAHMMRDRVMPDEISNFAHNNEWLIRNLAFVGRAHDAVELAKNMLELPQHPKYNTLEKQGGSANYGRRHLLKLLREYQLYDEAIRLCKSPYLGVEDNPEEQIKTLRLLACSATMSKDDTALSFCKNELSVIKQSLLDEQKVLDAEIEKLKSDTNVGKDGVDSEVDGKEEADEEVAIQKDEPKRTEEQDNQESAPASEKEKTESQDENDRLKTANAELATIRKNIKQIEQATLAVTGYELVAADDYKAAFEKLEKATGEDVSWLGELQLLGGEIEKGLEKISKQVDRRPQEVIPLARLAYLQFQNGDLEAAKTTFEKLRNASASMDLDLKLFSRLEPLAKELGFVDGWIKERERPTDLGFRPPLDSLGPFQWSPSPAPNWILKDSDNKAASSKQYLGKPVVVIFYLGHGCLHCAEQLHAFAPRVADFRTAGIEMVAISSDNQDGLQESVTAFDGEMPIRLVSDGYQEYFKKFRAYDDFEDQPLHGTFLIDATGMIRWQDISYEPFMDHEFLLKESKRLLASELNPILGQLKRISKR